MTERKKIKREERKGILKTKGNGGKEQCKCKKINVRKREERYA